jgi:hypothetical protein
MQMNFIYQQLLKYEAVYSREPPTKTDDEDKPRKDLLDWQ